MRSIPFVLCLSNNPQQPRFPPLPSSAGSSPVTQRSLFQLDEVLLLGEPLQFCPFKQNHPTANTGVSAVAGQGFDFLGSLSKKEKLFLCRDEGGNH